MPCIYSCLNKNWQLGKLEPRNYFVDLGIMVFKGLTLSSADLNCHQETFFGWSKKMQNWDMS